MLKIRKKKALGFLAFRLFLVTVFIRPHGIVFLIATTIYLFSVLVQTKIYLAHKKAIIRISLIVILLLLTLTGIAIQNFDFMSIKIYLTGDVVYLSSQYAPQFSSLSLNAEGLVLPDFSLPTVFQLVEFIFYNPFYFFQLSFSKLFFFFTHVKPYYSFMHNVLIGVTLYPLYFLSIVGVKKLNNVPARNFIVAFITLQALSVMLMVEDWDGRFLMPVLPFVIICSAVGLVSILNELNIRHYLLSGIK